MPLWGPNDHQVVYLRCWRVLELPNGDRHFNGYEAREQQGRVSSKIVEYDSEERRGTTRSGRQYSLVLTPQANTDADYTWWGWCNLNRVNPEDCRDVTEEYV